MWDSEPLEPQIHVDVTELGEGEEENRGKGYKGRREGVEEETDCRPRNKPETRTWIHLSGLFSPGHLS